MKLWHCGRGKMVHGVLLMGFCSPRAGTLYGELARFVLRLLGWNRPKNLLTEQQHQLHQQGLVPGGPPGTGPAVSGAPQFQPQRQGSALQLTSGQQSLAAAWPSASAASRGPGGQPGGLDGAWGGC